MFTLVCITVDLTPADVDVSLKDFPPASSEAVLPLLPWSGMENNFQKNKKKVK